MNAEELNSALELSRRPYLESEGPVKWSDYINLRSWRYVFEISSACNLQCALCHAGNRAGYEYTPGIMKEDLMERCLDKIQRENPKATVCAYVNSEPFLHPHLAKCIRSIRNRGLRCEIATNGNHALNDLEAVLEARPDLFTISVSGWTQEVYQRAHRGGDIGLVKQNIKTLAESNQRHKLLMGVSYHVYRDNQGPELEAMRDYTKNLGLMFLTSWGRVITIENTVQALRELDREGGGWMWLLTSPGQNWT